MSTNHRRRGLLWFLTAAGLLLSPALAHAQGFAVTGGANVNPDQIFAGGRYEWPLVEDVWFQPGADAGFGDNVKLFTVNFDVAIRKTLNHPWTVYAGGGPALNHYRWDNARDNRLGMNVLGGLRHSNGVFTEFRAALADGPDVRFTVGIMLGSATHGSHKTRRAR
jgi:hypothetical protein